MNDMSSRMNAAEADCRASGSAFNLDAAHIWRSKLVEKCAEAERHVLRLLQRAGATCQAKAPLSQKIEALKKALAVNLSNLRSAPILALLDDLRPLSDLRSDLVHSTVSVATVEGSPVAVFRKTSEQEAGVGDRRIITAAGFKDLHEALSGVANRLKQEAART
ncbi:MAG TPA: hypothetical protein VEW71_00620 [Allosphingosinicella sp.]|nr:hypothetical protein [Allosphingosinicella sp.]